VITWIVSGVFLLAVTLMGWGNLVSMVLTPVWFISLFLLTPAVTVLSFLLGVIGSARAKDARSAQNIVMLVIFPLFGLVAIQVTGVVWFTTLGALALALGLISLCSESPCAFSRENQLW